MGDQFRWVGRVPVLESDQYSDDDSTLEDYIGEMLVEVEELSTRLKRNMLQTIDSAQTGHLGACASSNELMSVLYFSDIMRLDSEDDKHPDRDLVLCRGHLGPLRYNIFAMLGWMDAQEMDGYRQYGTRLHGHEDMNKTPGVDLTPSGSLGMLLSYAVGARYSYELEGKDNRVFCFLGDGEEQEGNVSEAARHAANLGLDNLIVIIDRNGKQLSTNTRTVDLGSDLEKIWEGYGWEVIADVDGHDIHDVYKAYKDALARDGPVAIIADTVKGNGVGGAKEHYSGYHVYHSTSEDDTTNRVPLEEAIEELEAALPAANELTPGKRRLPPRKRREWRPWEKVSPMRDDGATSYDYLEEFLEALAEQGKREGRRVHVLSADYPPRNLIYGVGEFSIEGVEYCNTGIREQHLVSMAHGLRQTDPDALIMLLCGDPFMYRCADQVNVLAQSDDRVIIYAVQAGLSGARNGSTHQSAGQSGAFHTMPGVTSFEPSSKEDWFYAMNEALNAECPTYIRTHKGDTPYSHQQAQTGDYYSLQPGTLGDPMYTLITAGMPMTDAMEAAYRLYDLKGTNGRIINLVSPSRAAGISELILPDKPLVTLYNGNPAILTSTVARELVRDGIQPSSLHERGFDLGTTGSIADLKGHFGLDVGGIQALLEEATEARR